MDKQRVEHLRLIRTPGVGPVLFYRLMDRYKSAGRAIQALQSGEVLGKKFSVPTSQDIAKEIKSSEDMGIGYLFWDEAGYPFLLQHSFYAPPVLNYKGNLALLNRCVISIAGTRHASLSASNMASNLAAQMGEHGIVIASGLASGIDTAAHRGSLSSGTIAVMQAGLDEVYPASNAELFEEITQKGLCITEHPVGTVMHKHLFPRRNRLLASISRGVVLIEAAMKSGSIITARCALDEGREVFAVPGFPLDPRSRGCNALIKDGAVLVETVEDILENLVSLQLSESAGGRAEYFHVPLEEISSESASEEDFSLCKRKILHVIGREPLTVQEIIESVEDPVNLVHAAILCLEVEGHLEYSAPGCLVRVYGGDVGGD